MNERTCGNCHYWFCGFIELMDAKCGTNRGHQGRGHCVWHNGIKDSGASKVFFKGMLSTTADFGCSEWTEDKREKIKEAISASQS